MAPLSEPLGTLNPWKAFVLTLFPEMFPGPLGYSLAGQAMKDRLWVLETVDIRSFARDKHRTVDDTPFGGGPGMVMRPDVLDDALKATVADAPPAAEVIYLSPRGQPLTQQRVRQLAVSPGIVLLCGRYEGVDQRLLEVNKIDEISLGDFVLSGGEPAAIALIDAVVRLLPGVMGKATSGEDESFERGLLEYPQYTRPQNWQGRAVPEVLISGHHDKVRRWRQDQATRITKERRPDLWERYQASHKSDKDGK
ncbi:MAG: tRNA (guanosine(37)-N1)-methyltransferase TrmD [Alphaproteobacteria bacterium]